MERQGRNLALNAVVRDLADLVRLLVEQPRKVEILTRGSGSKPELVLRLDRGDRGRIIGRGGRTIQALRGVLAVRCRSLGFSCGLDLEGER